jgi:CubicO group peptidase (beta-lactamase class C family)
MNEKATTGLALVLLALGVEFAARGSEDASWIGATSVEAAAILSPQDEALARQLDTALRREVSQGFAGVVLVAHGDSLLIDGAYGATDTALHTGSRFVISSVAKQFVSTAVLALRERGLLRLTDPLSSYFTNAPADKAGITVLQLLSHQSGLGQAYIGESAHNREDATRALLAQPLIDTPGAGFHYSNSNYELLVAIIETVTKTNYHHFAAHELFEKAGLADTGFSSTRSWPTLAPTAGPLPERLKAEGWGAGGMYSTSHDLFAGPGPCVTKRSFVVRAWPPSSPPWRPSRRAAPPWDGSSAAQRSPVNGASSSGATTTSAPTPSSISIRIAISWSSSSPTPAARTTTSPGSGRS